MRMIDAGTAQQQLEDILETIERDGPVAVQQDGETVAFLLPPQLLDSLLAQPPAGVNPKLEALFKNSLVKRWQVYAGLRQYERDHKEE